MLCEAPDCFQDQPAGFSGWCQEPTGGRGVYFCVFMSSTGFPDGSASKESTCHMQYSICICAQSYPPLCDPMDCGPPGSSVRGILQARILEWVAMPSSRGSSQPRDQIQSLVSPALAGRFFTTTAPWEVLMCRDHAHFGKASLAAQTVKSLPAMRETWVRSLGREHPLEKEMQPTPVFLPGRSHGQRSLAGYSPWDHKELDMTEQRHFHFPSFMSIY